MKNFAQILNNKAHWIFEAEVTPQFAPDIVLVEVTDLDPQPAEGWDYIDGVFSDPNQLSLDELKTKKTNEIDAACKRVITEGFSYGDYRYDSEQEDQMNLQIAVIGAISGRMTVIPYRCCLPDGTKDIVEHTPEQMIAVGEAFGNLLETSIAKANGLKKSIAAATAKEELDTITW